MKTLDEIMLCYTTDKSSVHHDYCKVYEKFFEPLRDKPIKLLEAGIGGYEFVDRGGGDLYGFAEYFGKGEIYAFDLHNKRLRPHDRIHIARAEQDNESLLNILYCAVKPFDIIIDDASHHAQLTIKTFEILYPMLNEGGYYIFEDAHTAYWKEYYNGCEDRNDTDYPHIHNYINKRTYLNVVYHDDKLIIIKK